MRGMRLGLHALGIGTGADPAVIRAVAGAAERSGFATLWAGEHVVMVDESDSPYPYSDDGTIAVPADADWIDPMIGLAFAASATSTIGLATGVLLLPEHNPVIVAKQAASLDKLSGGRFSIGIGIGWSREEFEALGIPFERRAARTADYVAAMRTIWRDDIASYTGEFTNFESIRVHPPNRSSAESRSCVVATAMPHCGASRSGVTAGTASTCATSTTSQPRSRRCGGCVSRWGGTPPPSCDCRSRCANPPGRRRQAVWQSWVSTSWCWSPRRRRIRWRPRNG